MPEPDKKPKAQDQDDKWFLKIDDNSIFGPVTLSELQEWAEQGRIAPGNHVSQDKKKWLPSDHVAELDMVWTVELPNGSAYGPLNLKALVDLIEDKIVTPDSKLTNKTTEIGRAHV